jgi:hypothetical protein
VGVHGGVQYPNAPCENLAESEEWTPISKTGQSPVFSDVPEAA